MDLQRGGQRGTAKSSNKALLFFGGSFTIVASISRFIKTRNAFPIVTRERERKRKREREREREREKERDRKRERDVQ